ncbi:hypothetical protein VN97_g4795 [Penicillium thymicola]|uniref:Uncharacterized protein n=1 Tax=Penicillium thymicola TaxID=293382 RepID=A0AAI9TJX7_PENTH|nr:hypothetical protein VN97_g4795 [Penicillium thymicola]
MPSNEFLHTETININPGQYAFKERNLRVVCIGTDISGIILAHKLKQEHPLDFVGFSKYTKIIARLEAHGLRMSILVLDAMFPPTAIYVLPVEPNPNWSKCYAGGV